MQNSAIFILLSLLIVVILVITVRDAGAAVAIIALVANYMIIYRHLRMADTMVASPAEPVDCIIPQDCNGEIVTPTHDMDTGEPIKPISEAKLPDPVSREMYGSEQVKYDQYAQSRDRIDPRYRYIGRDMTADYNKRVELYQQQRANRNKNAIDGHITKTADYYKHHFGDELEETEMRDWQAHYE